MATIASTLAVTRSHGTLYRAVWRWHFYAGLIVLPVLLWMALTGGGYLYHKEIERWTYDGWINASVTGPPLGAAEMIAAVERQAGGRVKEVVVPAAADETWRMTIALNGGSIRTAFIDPGSGQALGTVEGGGIAETIRHLHSLTVAGPVGNVLVEVVAGWAIVLTLTGFYLWWPRSGQRTLSLAGRVGERRFWRNLHASTGALVGVMLLFLAVTGLPWSIFWGARFHALVAEAGIGRPKPAAVSSDHDVHNAALPWSLRGPVPAASHRSHDVGPNRALATGLAHGVALPLTLGLPAGPGRPYLVSHIAGRQQDAHVVYVDPASGAVLLDARGPEFGIGARVFEYAVNTHQGQQFGEANRLAMLAACAGVALLCLTAPVLWWKRRQGARLRLPPAADDPARTRDLAGVMLIVGALFPLTGATMVAALAAEAVMIALKMPRKPIDREFR